MVCVSSDSRCDRGIPVNLRTCPRFRGTLVGWCYPSDENLREHVQQFVPRRRACRVSVRFVAHVYRGVCHLRTLRQGHAWESRAEAQDQLDSELADYRRRHPRKGGEYWGMVSIEGAPLPAGTVKAPYGYW